MKKLATLAFALLLGASLSFAQVGGGSTDKTTGKKGAENTTATTGKKPTKTSKAHKGGKKSKTEDSSVTSKSTGGGSTTPK